MQCKSAAAGSPMSPNHAVSILEPPHEKTHHDNIALKSDIKVTLSFFMIYVSPSITEIVP